MVEEPISKTPPEPVKSSILEETKAAIEDLKKEREEISKVKDELKKLRSDQLLSGTAGNHIEPAMVTEAEKNKQGAKEFFKGTALEGAIDKL